MILALLLIIISYVMGSLCSAIIVCRIFNLPDPRKEGSKNPGATNVLRIAGKKYAAIVMLGDLLKGTIPVLLARGCEEPASVVSFTVLAAVLGHMYPVFFGFKGGKGVATALGALLGFHFMVGVMASVTWLLVAKCSRYSSLASIISITLAPFYALILVHQPTVLPPLFFMIVLILFKHKDNITRLVGGTEPKITLKSNVIQEIVNSPSIAEMNQAPGKHSSTTQDKGSKAKKPTKK